MEIQAFLDMWNIEKVDHACMWGNEYKDFGKKIKSLITLRDKYSKPSKEISEDERKFIIKLITREYANLLIEMSNLIILNCERSLHETLLETARHIEMENDLAKFRAENNIKSRTKCKQKNKLNFTIDKGAREG